MTLRADASVHDRSQIEVNIDYDFAPRIDVDFYFFVPRSLGVNSNTYTREQFYDDLTNNMRFHTPLGAASSTQTLSVLQRLLDPEVTAQSREEMAPYAIQQIKLYANQINTRLKAFYEAPVPGDLHEILADLSFARAYYLTPMLQPRLSVTPAVRQALLNVDEYLSNRVIATCSKLHGSQPALGDLLLKTLSLESEHRRTLGANYVEAARAGSEMEYFYYRHGLLKKFISRPLYISMTSAKQERVYRNWIAGCGAGMAGLWAQIADYQTHRMGGHKDLGLSFFFFAFLAILIYVFKDRIKDLSKEYFNEKLKGYLPDFKSKLHYEYTGQDLKSHKVQVGSCNEYVRFLSAQSVPDDVLYVRKMKGRRDIGEEHLERVIHFHKSVSVTPQSLRERGLPMQSIKDINRFNFSYFLDHLDDPHKTVSVYGDDEGPATLSAPKVYHLNMVLKMAGHEREDFAHYRVVMDKQGLLRMEGVSTPASIKPQELSL